MWVPEWKRVVVFRLGRPLDKPKGPGLVFLIPMIDRAVTVDLREQKRELFNQGANAKDFIPVSFDFRWYFKVIDPIKVLTVKNIELTLAGLLVTKLGVALHEISSGDLSSEQARLGYELIRTDPGFQEICGKLGVIVTNLEILRLAIDDRQKEINDARAAIGTLGETQTTVHTTGTVVIGDRAWDAMSNRPIAPNTKVRVKRVVLEVEEAASS